MACSDILQRDYCLQALNTLAVPCQSAAFIRLESIEDLASVQAYARAEGLPILPLGEGSNVVLAEQLEALVLQQACKGIEVLQEDKHAVSLRVSAGESWHALVEWCVARGYAGLENLALIPGTVGAAPVQNIGAYGVELAAFVSRVSAIGLLDGELLDLNNAECQFSYRDSIFKRELADQLLITAVDLVLPKHTAVNISYPGLAQRLEGVEEPTPRQVFDTVVSIRREKLPDPKRLPNAGSFFKNPELTGEQADALAAQHPDLPMFPQHGGVVRIAAAWLIEQCGFKSMSGNPVHVHKDHALVIVNPEHRGGSEILELAEDIVNKVEVRFGLTLVQEPRSYGWV